MTDGMIATANMGGVSLFLKRVIPVLENVCQIQQRVIGELFDTLQEYGQMPGYLS
jgi:hypothetical protein